MGGYVMSLHEAYLDESGCHDGSPVLAVGGYLIRSDRARIMSAKWQRVLANYEVPFFHMVDCAHGSKPFDRLPKWRRTKLVKEMIGLIKNYTSLGLVALANPRRFDDVPGIRDPYTFCVTDICMGLTAWLKGESKKQKGVGNIAFFIESGHQNGNKADAEIRRWSKTTPGGQLYVAHKFALKDEVPLLQAADLLVWQAHKFMKDKITEARPPRRDFVSLMRHPHTFTYVTPGKKKLWLPVDNSPLKQNVLWDTYHLGVFSNGAAADAIVEHFHSIEMARLARGGIKV